MGTGVARSPVTVVTGTIPGREQLLGECIASVFAQTHEVEGHVIYAQSCTEGLWPPHHVALQQNVALAAVETTWTMRLADDDKLLPNHIETLEPYFDSADVIYSYDATDNLPRFDCTSMPQADLIDKLSTYNWIDGSAVAIRTEALRDVGGWPTDWDGNHHRRGGKFHSTGLPAEDWSCFFSLAKLGARFRCVPALTWEYGVNHSSLRSSNM